MIVGELKQWKGIAGLAGLEEAFEFLEKNQNQELPLGKQLIEGDDIYAIVLRNPSRPDEAGQFESHRKYIDVQYLDAGMESIGFLPITNLTVSVPYQTEKDVEFYELPENYEKIAMYPGRFAVFFPGEGHLPNCHLGGEHQLSKIVIKVSSSLHKRNP
ncbi:MAG: YhcH/YjgK/YiaL family protein [Terriglobia bacterium]